MLLLTSCSASPASRGDAVPTSSTVVPTASTVPAPDRGGATAAPDAVDAVFLGDSYTVGTGDVDRVGYVPDVAAALGWEAVNQGQGGTGYVNPGAHQGLDAFGGRVAAVAAADPDIVIVQGSTNDIGVPPAQLEQAALDLYAALRLAVPRADVLVVGPVAAPVVAEAIAEVRDALASAAARSGLPFVDPVAARWLTSADLFGVDGLHPNDGGYRVLADEVVDSLRELGY